MRTELFLVGGQMDIQRDRHTTKLLVTFHNFAKRLKWWASLLCWSTRLSCAWKAMCFADVSYSGFTTIPVLHVGIL